MEIDSVLAKYKKRRKELWDKYPRLMALSDWTPEGTELYVVEGVIEVLQEAVMHEAAENNRTSLDEQLTEALRPVYELGWTPSFQYSGGTYVLNCNKYNEENPGEWYSGSHEKFQDCLTQFLQEIGKGE